MGPAGSENWHAMLDASEATLLEEGYGALTSRRIAERVGVKQRLVYYYFATMDEIIVETFKRMAERELQRMRATLQGATPVWDLWNVCVHTTDSRLTSEFMALANRNEELRREVVSFIEEARRIQAEAVTYSLATKRNPTGLEPAALALLASGVALAMTREAAIGIKSGHANLIEQVENLLQLIEPR